jgi:NAD(P)-dependent dehydrogenase (short-subunit alcohol dehydrogenase family)
VVPLDISGTEIKVDLRDEKELSKAFSAAVAGRTFTDVSLVNCVSSTVFTHSFERTAEEIAEVLFANVGITVIASNAFAQICEKMGWPGQIVNVSSIFSKHAPRFEIYAELSRRSSEVYGASKAGVEQLTRYYAKFLGKQRIRVNCVAPGGIYDPKVHSEGFENLYGEATALGRMVRVTEVVDAVDFLVSKKSSAITGVTLEVDCGYGL